MKLTKLEQLGLTKKQAKIYLACLELGSGTAQQIAEKARLPKSTVYDIMNSLISNGLVHTYRKGKKKYFSAADPELLQDKLKRQKQALDEIFPELQVLFS